MAPFLLMHPENQPWPVIPGTSEICSVFATFNNNFENQDP
jgi:hypothetical protein